MAMERMKMHRMQMVLEMGMQMGVEMGAQMVVVVMVAIIKLHGDSTG